MSVAVELFFEGLKKVGQATKHVAGGLWDALEHPVAMGAQELARAVVGKHDGFVLYPEGMAPPKPVEAPAVEAPAVTSPIPEQTPKQERGGRKI